MSHRDIYVQGVRVRFGPVIPARLLAGIGSPPAVPRCTTDSRLRAGCAAVRGRHRAWRRRRPLDRLPYPVLRRGSRRKKRHKPDPATNNTFHASGGSLTHASEGGARRCSKRSNPWRSIAFRGCYVVQNHRSVPRSNRRLELGLRIYESVAEANAQKRTRPRVGIGRPLSPPPLFSIVSAITADTPVDANSIHSTDIAPELVRTIEAGSSRPCRPRVGASGSTTTLAAGRIPSSVLINAPLALTLSRQPRHLQPLSGDCMQLSRTGMFVESRCPQRCSIDLSLKFCTLIMLHPSWPRRHP